MGSKYIPEKGNQTFKILTIEKCLLDKYYDFLHTQIRGKTLIVKGYYQPSEFSIKYSYKIIYELGDTPKVFPYQPNISYHSDIHIYRTDNSLCLYYPKDFQWKSTTHLYNTIIPWTHEWYLYYELYQIGGKWLHPFVDH